MSGAKRRYVGEVLRNNNSTTPFTKVEDNIETHLIALASIPLQRVATTGVCVPWPAKQWSWA